jgi:DUF1680 family protein
MIKKYHVFYGIFVLALWLTFCSREVVIQKDYPIKPVPFTQVTVDDDFWKGRLDTNQDVTIPYAFQKCEETGRIQNFEVAGGLKKGTFEGKYPFNDSDVYKVMEGAAYSLQVKPNPQLNEYLDDLIKKIKAAQEADGYLYTARTINPTPPVIWCDGPRWSNLYLGHELYNMGHFYEAAVAHYQATGKKSMLDIAVKNANLIDSIFGSGKKRGVPGHQVIEIGLAKLYRITGNQKYLDLAKFFLDERGKSDGRKLFGEYSQDHKPVLEQTEAVGHAVRAAYMYAGMADIAALSGDQSYIEAIDRLWENVVSKKLYITGGIGSTGAHEGFGSDYVLPNSSAYAETCASIANAFWNHRMFLLNGDAKYIDVLERILYNGLLSGISIEGDRFFYPNPLRSFGQHERSPWFGCACCPSNIARFMPSIPGYIYALKDDTLYVNLYIQGEAKIKLSAVELQIRQQTGYPWDGQVNITVNPHKPANFDLMVRIPGWTINQPVPSDLYGYIEENKGKPIVKVNSKAVPFILDKGYVRLSRRWASGDKVGVTLPMPLRRVISHPQVVANRGRVAFERGPVVYCAEAVDNSDNISNLLVKDETNFKMVKMEGVFDSVLALSGEVAAFFQAKNQKGMEQRSHQLILIPYYAWAHRGKGEMAVWLARKKSAAYIKPLPTIASTSKVTASSGIKGIVAINDLYEPNSSNDKHIPRTHWWPKKGTTEWVQYEFLQPNLVSEVSVFWFDDTGTGECRIPKSWKILYQKGNQWIPVKSKGIYPNQKDVFNRVEFVPVKTKKLQLVMTFQEKFSGGIMEWKVE